MYAALFYIILMLLWVAFSGLLDPFHLTLGAISCGIVTLLSANLLFPAGQPGLGTFFKRIFGLFIYSFWLLKEIIVANIHVFYLAMIPGGMKHMQPELVRIKVGLQSDAARYVLANSITLTPGTVSVKMDDDELLVHSISRTTTEGLEGDMEKRIARIFDESL